MSATTIHFVRHGKVYNPDHLLYERLPDFHLSDLGRRMAQATAAYLANSPQTNTISAVYSSPLDRTRETADAILDALNPVREARGEAPLMLTADERVIEAGNEFRGKRIGHGEGARPRLGGGGDGQVGHGGGLSFGRFLRHGDSNQMKETRTNAGWRWSEPVLGVR